MGSSLTPAAFLGSSASIVAFASSSLGSDANAAELDARADVVRAHPRVHDPVDVMQRPRVVDQIVVAPLPRGGEGIALRREGRVRVRRALRRGCSIVQSDVGVELKGVRWS